MTERRQRDPRQKTLLLPAVDLPIPDVEDPPFLRPARRTRVRRARRGWLGRTVIALEIAAPGHTFRVQTLFSGDELGWSALLMGRGKHFQARTLERVDALAFEGSELLGACNADTNFGYTLMQRLLAVVAERLQATRLQLLDTYSPIAARAGA